jgi:hypothetical protein
MVERAAARERRISHGGERRRSRGSPLGRGGRLRRPTGPWGAAFLPLGCGHNSNYRANELEALRAHLELAGGGW